MELLTPGGIAMGAERVVQVGPAELRQANALVALSAAPGDSVLLPNYPNPFNPETWIPFQMAEASTAALRIYNSGGRLVRTLDLGHVQAGFHLDRADAVRWDGRNDSGEGVGSGVYHVELRTPTGSDVRRVVIAR